MSFPLLAARFRPRSVHHRSVNQVRSNLQLQQKGNIGRQYDSNTTIAVLKDRLDAEFEKSMGWHESVEGFICAVMVKAKEFWKNMEEETEDTADIDEDNSSDSEEESESGGE